MIEKNGRRIAICVALFGVLVPAGFAAWAEISPITLVHLAHEDGPIEYLSAFLFLVASLGFVVASLRSEFLRRRSSRWAYFFTLSWAALMAVFVGEEISWGQRIFDVATPKFLDAVNVQHELNIHNTTWLDDYLGGSGLLLAIMMVLTGLVIPLASRISLPGRLLQRLCFPVAPLRYVTLFIVPLAWAKYYHLEFREIGYDNTAWEVRELILGVALAAFALHGARAPDELFRAHRRWTG